MKDTLKIVKLLEVVKIISGIRAGRKFHGGLVEALLHFPISFYDKTPTGRILNRVGKDIETVDGQLVRSLEMWLHCLFRKDFKL